MDTNAQLLSEHLSIVLQWGRENKVDFSPKTMELLHIVGKKRNQGNPAVTVDLPDGSALTVMPVPAREKAMTKDQRENAGVLASRLENERSAK